VPSELESDPFADNLAYWWTLHSAKLPGPELTLALLNDHELGQLANAYEALVGMTAAVTSSGRERSFAPTATSKNLYFLRPNAVTAWDKKISQRLSKRGPGAFETHLLECRSWARALVAEAAARGIQEKDIGPRWPTDVLHGEANRRVALSDNHRQHRSSNM
jgi:hypothetical protein